MIQENTKFRISFFDFMIMVGIWLMYLKYFYSSEGMPQKLNLILGIFGVCFWFAALYEITLKEIVKNRKFTKIALSKVFIVWFFPILMGVFSTNVIFPYIKSHDNTKIFVQLSPFDINITKKKL